MKYEKEEFDRLKEELSMLKDSYFQLEKVSKEHKETKEVLHNVINAIPGVIFSFSFADEAGGLPVIDFISGRWGQWTGISPDESVADPSLFWKSAESFNEEKSFADTISAARKDGRGFKYGIIVTHEGTGTKRNIHCFLVPILDAFSDVVGFAGVGVDVTEQVKSQEDLRRMFDIVDNARDFIGYASSDGQIQYINKAGMELVGIDEEDVTGADIGDYGSNIRSFMPKGTFDFLSDEALPKAMDTGSWRGELTYTNKKTGKEIPVSVRIVVRRGEKNEIKYIAAISRDITERKKHENELKDKVEELEKFMRLTVGRELKMAELKERIKDMEKKGRTRKGRSKNVK